MSNVKTVLITGASRGIGLLTAKTLATAGYRVFAGMRDARGRNAVTKSELKSWASDQSCDLEVVDLDVTDDASVLSAVRQVEDRAPVDILINNAGIMPVGVTEAYTIDQFKDLLDVNVLGAARLSRAVLPFMRARRQGLLIHISSAAGRLAIPYFGIYCASKFALEAYAEALHYELADFGIESVLVEPSGHATDLISNPPAPAEVDRVLSYGPSADGPRRLLNMFEDMFAAGEEITDAQNVANRIMALIETEAPRPIRTVVGHDMGLDALDASAAPIQAALIDSLQSQLAACAAPLTVVAEINLKPEYFEKGKAAIEAIIPKTRTEPGCREFTLIESQEIGGKVVLYEVFDDEAALQHHYNQAYTREVFDQYEEWLASPVVVKKMQALGARLEAA